MTAWPGPGGGAVGPAGVVAPAAPEGLEPPERLAICHSTTRTGIASSPSTQTCELPPELGGEPGGFTVGPVTTTAAVVDALPAEGSRTMSTTGYRPLASQVWTVVQPPTGAAPGIDQVQV